MLALWTAPAKRQADVLAALLDELDELVAGALDESDLAEPLDDPLDESDFDESDFDESDFDESDFAELDSVRDFDEPLAARLSVR